MVPFTTSIPVRFGDIDHAGIVYYPRFFHYLHVAFEDFFEEHVGIAYADLLEKRKVGFPTVHADVDFRKPFVFGDVARVSMDVVRLGRSSMTIRYRIRKRGSEEIATEARVTTACVDMETFESRPIPEDLRAAFAELVSEGPTTTPRGGRPDPEAR